MIVKGEMDGTTHALVFAWTPQLALEELADEYGCVSDFFELPGAYSSCAVHDEGVTFNNWRVEVLLRAVVTGELTPEKAQTALDVLQAGKERLASGIVDD